MWPFKGKAGVQRLLSKVLGKDWATLTAEARSSRIDPRVKHLIVGLVVPIEGRQIQAGQAFTAVTQDFSKTGVGIVVKGLPALEQAVLGFRHGGPLGFVRGEVRHTTSIGGGFYLMGFELFEVVLPSDYPELESLSL